MQFNLHYHLFFKMSLTVSVLVGQIQGTLLFTLPYLRDM